MYLDIFKQVEARSCTRKLHEAWTETEAEMVCYSREKITNSDRMQGTENEIKIMDEWKKPDCHWQRFISVSRFEFT